MAGLEAVKATEPTGLLRPLGQEDALRVLAGAAAAGRLAQAYLLVGPAGAGKGTMAEYVACGLQCAAASGRPCGLCPDCLAVLRGVHPDVRWLGSDVRLGIDEARAVREHASRRPVRGRLSVFVVEACERLTGAAAGALLKVLEEPPGAALFLFLADHPAAMEPTLRSRCVVVRLRPVPAGQIEAWLELERPQVPPDDRAFAARCSDGLPGLARAAADGPSGSAVREVLLGALAESGSNPAAIVDAAGRLAALGASPWSALTLLRNAAVVAHGLPAEQLGGREAFVDPDQAASLLADLRFLVGAAESCLAAADAEAANVNAVLNWQVLLSRLHRYKSAC